jgi:hypothetical protein
MRLLADLFKGLKGVHEGGEEVARRCWIARWYFTDRTWATRMPTPPSTCPCSLAGGGFRHAGHLAFDRTQNYPLPNLFVSMLQRMGIEMGNFASSTGKMSGLELTKA